MGVGDSGAGVQGRGEQGSRTRSLAGIFRKRWKGDCREARRIWGEHVGIPEAALQGKDRDGGAVQGSCVS